MTGAHHHILLLENVSGKRLCEKQRSWVKLSVSL
jgi:hypothetical protein